MSLLVQRARSLARTAHAGQTYPPEIGKIPFEAHLGHVIGVLSRFEVDAPILHAAAWLHDVVEDTSVTLDVISNTLGCSFDADQVVTIVRAVTDEPGANRAERKAKTYPKIAAAGPMAITVKLADRIANVESSIIGYPHFLEIYTNEHAGFTSALRLYGGPPSMWAHLHKLIGFPKPTREELARALYELVNGGDYPGRDGGPLKRAKAIIDRVPKEWLG